LATALESAVDSEIGRSGSGVAAIGA
jgi:hypothetical protein